MSDNEKKTLTVGVVPVNEDPYMKEIPAQNESVVLAALNEIVGGYIESFDALSTKPDVTIYVNERGIPMDLPPNRAVYATKRMAMLGYTSQMGTDLPVRENELYVVLFGDFAIVAHNRDGSVRDLTEKEFHEMADRFFGTESQKSGRRELERLSNKTLADECPDGVILLATNETDVNAMHREAVANGIKVKTSKVWNGPVPPNSYEPISPTTRMSTPEFYLFRKTNADDPVLARLAAVEMFGRYRTKLTCESMEENRYEIIPGARTFKKTMHRYLRPVADTEQATVTESIIETAPEDTMTPLQGWLATALCMPTELGGYGLETPLCATTFIDPSATDEMPNKLYPAAHGRYLAYDLIWPDRMLVVQHTGNSEPDENDASALDVAGTFEIIHVTDEMLSDAIHAMETLDIIAERILGHMPEGLNRDAQRHVLELMPNPDDMLMTYDSLSRHA